MADKSNCQILYGNDVCRRSICFVKAGISIYFVKVINTQVIIGTLPSTNLLMKLLQEICYLKTPA